MDLAIPVDLMVPEEDRRVGTRWCAEEYLVIREGSGNLIFFILPSVG